MKMTFKIIPHEELDKINGTFGRGEIKTTFHKLVELFGEPIISQCDKTQVEWAIEWNDDTITTIYDWKECKNPIDITEWSVGGNSQLSIDYLKELLN